MKNSHYKDYLISYVKTEYHRLAGLVEELERNPKLDLNYLDAELKDLGKAFKRIRKRIRKARKNKL